MSAEAPFVTERVYRIERPHGSATTYGAGCRCRSCTDAQAAATRQVRLRRKLVRRDVLAFVERLIPVAPDFGTASSTAWKAEYARFRQGLIDEISRITDLEEKANV